MSFQERKLEFQIAIAKGAQGQLDGETLTLTGYRAHVSIQQSGGGSQGQAQIAIYGVPLDLMNRLTVTGPVQGQIRTKNRIEVLTSEPNRSVVFAGGIFSAWADMQASPEIALRIEAYSAIDQAMSPATATSFNGTATIHDIMERLAEKAGLRLEDSGVTGSLSNPAFRGSILQQIRKAAQAANIHQSIELGTLAIWPMHGHRKAFVPILSPGKGLVGYPSYSSAFVSLQSEYLPTVKIGGQVEVRDSAITPANGTWNVAQFSHELSSMMPDGPWFTHLEVNLRDA